jgi:MoaA/NifB/PqqE/SkfB family radical SAM enzyme
MYLSVFVTNKCTAACAHCCVGSGPDRSEVLEPDLLEATLRRLRETGFLHGINLVGGEPTLAKQTVKRALGVAAETGMHTQMVTNCAFGRNEAQARDVVEQLYEAGLQHLHLSYDDYHAPFVDIERVRNTWLAARQFAFRSVVVIAARRNGGRINKDVIEAALGEPIEDFDKAAMEKHGNGTYRAFASIPVQRVGRGAVELDDADMADLKPGVSITDLFRRRCPSALNEPALSARGHLVACGGVELDGNMFLDFGDIRDSDPLDLFARGARRPVANAIAQFGPGFLMKMA